MAKHILLTGGAGFIGFHCVRYWLERTNWHITILDSLRHRGRSERIQALTTNNQRRLSFHKVDLTNLSNLSLGSYDVIVNMASDSHVDRSISDPVSTWTNNTSLVQQVLEFARKHPCKQFIQISTDEVYGPAEPGEAHKEWSPIRPSNPYAASKAAQEALCQAYWRTYSIPVVITNTMNNFGEWQDSEKFVPKIIKHLLNNKPVPVHGSPEQSGSRCYLHATNHADALMFLINSQKPLTYPEFGYCSRWNVVGEEEVTNLEMVFHVARIMSVKRRITVEPLYEFVDFHSTRPGHDQRYKLDGTKLRDAGWRAPKDFLTSLRHTVSWYLDNPDSLQDYKPE